MSRKRDAKMTKVYNAVEANIGGGKVICDRCGCTLETFSDVCSAALTEECQGFVAIDRAKAAALAS